MVPALFIVLEQLRRQHAVGRGDKQDEQGQLSHTGDKWQQVAAQKAGLLDGENDLDHALPPAHALNHGRLLDLVAQLQHGVDARSGGEGQVFDRTDRDFRVQGVLG